MKHTVFFLSLLAIILQFCSGNTILRPNVPVLLPPKTSNGDGSGLSPALPTDDEDAGVGIGVGGGRTGGGSVSGDGPSPWRPPGGAGSVSGDGDFRRPPPPPLYPGGGGNSTPIGVVSISLPVLSSAVPPSVTAGPPGPGQQRPRPTQRTENEAAGAPSCSSQSGRTVTARSALFQIRYRPMCQPSRPVLYQPQQCGTGACFCVDPRTGNLTEGTAVPANRQLSCSLVAFSVTLGFSANWHESMGQTSTASFHNVAQLIENEINRLFKNYQGHQRATVLRLRSGSVIADIRLTSIGHPPRLESNVQDLKQLLDDKIASGTFAGMRVIPEHYFFQRKDNTNGEGSGEGGSNQDGSSSRSSGGAHGNTNQDDRSDPNAANKAEGGSSEASGSGDGNNPLSAASLFSSPGILAAIASGGVGLVLLVVLLALFCAYRARKAGEGSYKVNGAKNGAKNGAAAANGKRSAPRTELAYARAPSSEFYA